MPNRQARLPRKRSRNGRNECHHPPACRAKAEGEGEMTEQESEALVDLLFGTTKALEVICRQLIDAKILNAEILIADLEQAQVEIARRRRVGILPSCRRGLLLCSAQNRLEPDHSFWIEPFAHK